MGTLFMVATPIGNLEDITLRALRVLKEVDWIASEDTRHTGQLLRRYGITTRQVSFHEHNTRQRLDRLLRALDEGDVALVSDAGTPGVSDPGFELVQAALAAGHRVRPIPGPSAPVAALIASGLPTDSFLYLGYLPRQAAERRRMIATLAEERRTVVCFEVPHRLRAALADLAGALGDNRQAAVCRELTKLHEDIRRGTLASLVSQFGKEAPRGEITLVIAGARETARWEEARVRRALERQSAAGATPTEAARAVSEESGWPRREVYQLAIKNRRKPAGPAEERQ